MEGKLLVSKPTNYQGYTLDTETGQCTPTNGRSIPKWDAVKGVFPGVVKGQVFMDIGSAQGFFCWKALECGAVRAIGIELRDRYWQELDQWLAPGFPASKRFQWAHLAWPGQTQHLQADVVMCLSLVHHLFPRMSLATILQTLAASTIQHLFVEWIGRGDKMVIKKGWVGQHPEYTREQFLLTAQRYFAKTTFIHEGHHPSRAIYLMEKAA
jgi:hypothetical protein